MFKKDLGRIFSGSLLVLGTAIGAGMLGIPLLTAKAGFLPATVITVLCWAFMLSTGLLFLEASLWMPENSNLVSITRRFLGQKGRFLAAGMFLFLYYNLLVAYFAAGAPLFAVGLSPLLGFELEGFWAYLIFGFIFGAIVARSAKWIDRANLILSLAMLLTYVLVVGMGSGQVSMERLQTKAWTPMFFAAPMLFSAFGYHNIIPSLCNYLDRRVWPLRLSIIIGTTIPLVVYLLWQWLFIGAVPNAEVARTLEEGKPVTWALQVVTANPWIYLVGQAFAFFALVTSLLGVAFSMVDFIGDALKMQRHGKQRVLLTLFTFLPPFVLTLIDPTIFDKALGVAGGFGEAFLNGLLPITIVWIGRYRHNLLGHRQLRGGKFVLALLALAGLIVVGLEVAVLLQ